MTRLYKWLGPDGESLWGEGRWNLPTGEGPGEPMPALNPAKLKACFYGYHGAEPHELRKLIPNTPGAILVEVDLGPRAAKLRSHRGELMWVSVEGRCVRIVCTQGDDEARQAYDEARRAYEKAGRVYGEAREATDEAERAYEKAGRAKDGAWQAWQETRHAYDKAWQAKHEAERAYNKAQGTYYATMVAQVAPKLGTGTSSMTSR